MALGIAVAAIFVVTPVYAQQSDDPVSQVRAVADQLAQVEERYLQPALLRSRYQIESRFNDAKVAYVLGDYSRAALLFVGLVDNPRAQQFDSYREALFLLADSLYRERNFLAAKKYFREVVDRGRGRFYQESLVKLLELAAQTGNYEGIEQLYDELDSGAEVSASVHYMRGKTLYRQGRHAEARRFFQRAGASKRLSARADYFRAITFAAEGQLDNARAVFEEIVADLEQASLDEVQVRDLAYLGLGRICYEQGDYDQAVDYYQRLKRDSAHFDQMLYELTWTFIAQEKFRAASRVADIFLYLSNPEPTFVPRIKLLKADLHLRLSEYDAARAGFTDVIESFSPLQRELAEFVGERQDLEAFFYELVESQERGERPKYMPKLVQQWVDQSEVLDKARLTVSDLAATSEQVEDSKLILDQVEARLESGALVESFPKLAEGLMLGVEIESRIVELREEMIDEHHRLAAPKMSAQEEQGWSELSERVSAMRERYAAVPNKRADMRQRAERIEASLDELSRQLDRVTFELDNQREQLEAIDDYLDNSDRHDFTPQQIRSLERERSQVNAVIAELRKLRRQVHGEVEVARQSIGVGDKVAARERAIRAEYRRLLGEQREFLEQIRAPVRGSELEQIQTARQRLQKVEHRLQGFNERMDELVGQRADELRRDVASERKLLAMLEEEIDLLREESKQNTAAVARHSFKKVEREFYDLVMRGDIGLVDVAWQRKEDTTGEINQLFEDRTAELKMLQEAFEEVR